MNKVLLAIAFFLSCLLLISFKSNDWEISSDLTIDSLRKVYSQPSKFWPKPNVDKEVKFEELAGLQSTPIDLANDSIKRVIELGKLLFFDARLSGSNQISCATCHSPELSWADGKAVSLGHEQLPNIRNAPSLENVWVYNSLFWDGRAKSLVEQAEGPISAHNEMNQDLKSLAKKLNKIKGYKPYFTAAFGSSKITNQRIFESLATFQQTIVSGESSFDKFLKGDKNALTDQQLTGLHLFRTKARCMNCHHGAYFTDKDFHNIGLTEYGTKNEDLGLYNFTKKPEDVGKFKTPGLRNVMQTGPWFHQGSVKSMDSLMVLYNMGMPEHVVLPHQKDDPLVPKNDKLVRGIMLNVRERKAIIAFLEALSSPPVMIKAVQLPQ
ncbi:cytochrome-c peroxidase [Pedobacter xixiisoli]|uniref:Methylamine utilization protein MauG n=1 Tax=Pedobacter xixiisoli TaxID=1476464 RepID=A0A285ZU13_9SPHI|nr:cytochrome c peroxidase [Pedobacter xixiisoli]SOD13134.1 cytochrome c peroxidase [Pedobacter xixiisoli]